MQRYFRPAARLVILNEENEILLVRHKRYWALPGWGIDIWESIETALNRESIEELNTPAQMDQIIFIQDYLDERREWKIHALEYFCTVKNTKDFENVVQNSSNMARVEKDQVKEERVVVKSLMLKKIHDEQKKLRLLKKQDIEERM